MSLMNSVYLIMVSVFLFWTCS